MAKFLNGGSATFHLEELIRHARTRLVLVSPCLKFSGRTKELLREKKGLEVRVIYGENDLLPDEINWLRGLDFVRTSFCPNLRAKCYLNEEFCLVTSLSLFDFSQVTNHEMGVWMSRAEDGALYQDAREEVERIIRSGDEVKISVDKVDCVGADQPRSEQGGVISGKVSTSRLAKKLGLKTHELLDGLERLGAIEVAAGQKHLTANGARMGGEIRSSARFGNYFVWPEKLELSELAAPVIAKH